MEKWGQCSHHNLLWYLGAEVIGMAMRRTLQIVVMVGALGTVLGVARGQGSVLDRVRERAAGGQGAGLSDGQIGSGIKEALSVGSEKAVKEVARPGGYLENEEIKILLPKNLQPVERIARSAGQGQRIDEFVASMNHAAEDAAPEAGRIFGDAVRAMTIDDARRLLAGGDTSITDYFREKTSAGLAEAFRPHVEKAMASNGVAAKYEAVTGSGSRLGGLLGGGGGFDLNKYVVDKALEGLFVMLGKQEKEIRSNPAARTTVLLKQVFGR